LCVCQDTSVSGLWTPSGADPDLDTGSGAGSDRPGPEPRDGEPTEEQRAAAEAELARIQEELAATPVAEIIANHAIGLWQLAVLHLTREDRDPEAAGLAIDGLAALVDGLGARLGPNEGPLRDALAQVRLAYVQVTGGNDTPET
jgi:hypothetical protein